MKKTFFPYPSFFIFTLLLLFSCNWDQENKSLTSNDSLPQDATFIPQVNADSLRAEILKTLPADYKTIFGYRFIIQGDFNGDGKKETLTEHYASSADGKETNKFYDSTINEDQFMALIHQKLSYVYLSCSDKKIDTLDLEAGEQVLGIAYLKNEGDLDGDGGDEISFVRDWADWSNMNSVSIYTLKKGLWKEYISFEIHESDLPDLPEHNPAYKNVPPGMLTRYYDADTTCSRLEKGLKEFKGLVVKAGNGKIKVNVYSGETGNYVEREIDLKKLER